MLSVTMILADHVQSAEGKLNVIGGGWTFTEGGVNAVPFGIGMIVEVPWDMTNHPHTMTLSLEDEDGAPIVLPDGNKVSVSIQFEVGRPPGHPKGVPLIEPFSLNSGPLPLEPGRRYVWRCRFEDEVLAARAFQTRSA